MEIDPGPFEGRGSGVDAFNPTETAARPGRRDGRSHNEMRPVTILHSPLSQADGSARIKLGITDVLVAVYGPIDAPIHKQNADSVHVLVAYRQRESNMTNFGGGNTNADAATASEATTTRNLRHLVNDILLSSLFPRKSLMIAVHVLSDRGSVLATAYNATMLALLDAGVPMRSLPVATSVSLSNASLSVDPLRVEELEADATVTAVFDDAIIHDEQGFMSVSTDGDCCNEILFSAAIHTCRQLAVKVRAFLTLSLEQKADRSYVWKGKS